MITQIPPTAQPDKPYAIVIKNRSGGILDAWAYTTPDQAQQKRVTLERLIRASRSRDIRLQDVVGPFRREGF